MAKRDRGSSLRAAAKLLGKKGGKKGGPARARRLTQAQIKEIAVMGGKAAHQNK
jgi:hypothetical protein